MVFYKSLKSGHILTSSQKNINVFLFFLVFRKERQPKKKKKTLTKVFTNPLIFEFVEKNFF